jgi:co-chaperonin GroES (HSP10)
MKYKLNPTLGRIVISPMPEEQKTEAGIILVAAKEHSTSIATVIAVCAPYVAAPDDMDAMEDGPNFKIGDIVVIGKWSGAEVTVGRGRDAQKSIIINESDVLATLTEDSSDDRNQT